MFASFWLIALLFSVFHDADHNRHHYYYDCNNCDSSKYNQFIDTSLDALSICTDATLTLIFIDANVTIWKLLTRSIINVVADTKRVVIFAIAQTAGTLARFEFCAFLAIAKVIILNCTIILSAWGVTQGYYVEVH